MKDPTRVWAGVVAACVLLAGCTAEDPDPAPTVDLSPVSPTPSPGTELMCGIDESTIELITGFTPDRSDGDLTVQDEVGTARCNVWTDDPRHKDHELLIVELIPASSERGAELRRQVDGEYGNPPDVVYPRDVVDGAYWETGAASTSRVFWGETAVQVFAYNVLVRSRERSEDLLAVNQQVAFTLGLQSAS